MKRDYIEMMPKPDRPNSGGQFGDRVRALQRAPPAQRLGVSFPREYLRSRVSDPKREKSVLDLWGQIAI